MRTSIILFIIILYSSCYAQSPYHIDTKQEIIIYSGAVGLGIPAYFVNKGITPLTYDEINNLNSNSINSFDRSAINHWSPKAQDFSDFGLLALLVSPGLFTFSKEMRNDFGTIFILYSQAMLYNVVIQEIVKGAVLRTRPYAYNDKVEVDKKTKLDTRKSFFSGHASTAFTSAIIFSMFFSDYHPNSWLKPYVWGGSILGASLVGYLRYRGGMHFPTDIIAGAVVGSAIGYLIPYLHYSKGNKISVAPVMSNNFSGVNINLKF